jgi:anti-sigma B factor antagonist
LPLEITQREVEGVYVLALEGRLVLGAESSGFLKTVENILASGNTQLVINLERVNYIDSAGLGALIEVRQHTTAVGGRLALSSLRPNFSEVLRSSRLINIFETFQTEAAAIQSF